MNVCDMLLATRHIGIYVTDMDASLALYKKLYDIPDEQIRQVPPPDTPDPPARFAFIPLGGTEFELIQPISEEFRRMVSNPPPGINHIAFTVNDIEEAVACMHAKGVRLGHVTRDGILDMPASRVAYFNPEDTGGILVEFVEPAKQG
jgi:methylmalonyl-CoA/ethylmalonyl-CoA epimerase